MNPAHLDDTMMALADRTRRSILHRLLQGEARVTEIAKPFNMSLNAVSKHILVLERARLVHRRRKGREHFLSVNTRPLDEALHWIEDCRRLWEHKLERLDDYLNELQAGQKKPPQSKEQKHGRAR